MLDKKIVHIVEGLQTKVDGVLEKLEVCPGMSMESL